MTGEPNQGGSLQMLHAQCYRAGLHVTLGVTNELHKVNRRSGSRRKLDTLEVRARGRVITSQHIDDSSGFAAVQNAASVLLDAHVMQALDGLDATALRFGMRMVITTQTPVKFRKGDVVYPLLVGVKAGTNVKAKPVVFKVPEDQASFEHSVAAEAIRVRQLLMKREGATA